MIRQDIDINGYWKIIVLYNVYLVKKDTGFTYTNSNKRTSIIWIADTTNQE